MMTINNRTPLKAALEKQKLTNVWLANKLAVTDSTVSRWRNGHAEVPKVKQARIADLLGMRIEELFANHLVNDNKGGRNND